MLYKYTIANCECWLTEETINTLEKERLEIEAEEKLFKDLQYMYNQACESNDPMDWAIYSDLYKDYHGIRPW